MTARQAMGDKYVVVRPVPAQADLELLEVLEETGVRTRVVSDGLFTHPAVTTHAVPYTIIEMDVADSAVGPHRHFDLVYVLRAEPGLLTAELDEVAATRWVPVAELAEFDTPAELPALVTEAASWANGRGLLIR